KNLYIGVQFITPTGIPPDVEKLARAKPIEATAEAVRAQMALRRRYLSQRSDSRAAAYVERRELAGSSIAIGMAVLLLSIMGVFYVAGLQIDTPWARDLCENATNLCEHPELSGVPAALMTVVYLAVKGMEV
ncbi:MAG TPA: hypothetical protein VKB96_12730, partial [Gammaproteobacteria bacterium]|nr:hypothetical protein [Gammaproteobacteria bacterium]